MSVVRPDKYFGLFPIELKDGFSHLNCGNEILV